MSSRASTRDSSGARIRLRPVRPNQPAKGAAIVVQQCGKGGIQEFALRKHDQVQPGVRPMVSEKRSHAAFRAIAPHRLPQPPRGDDAQPAHGAPVRQPGERHIPPAGPDAALLYPSKLGAPSDALLACQRPGRTRTHGFNPRQGADTTRRRSAAGDLWPAAG